MAIHRGTMTMHQLLICTLLLMAVTIQISEAFVVNHPIVGGILGHVHTKSSQATSFHAASSSENNDQDKEGGGEGGTEWIKNAMGTANSNNDNPSSSNTPPPPPPSAPYTEDEIKTMENLILELSLEKDDTIRRAKLSAIFDKVFELDVDATTTTDADIVDGSNAASSDGSSNEGERREEPRFAQLFQYSLDNVGELVQCAAREKAELLNNSDNSNNDESGSSSSIDEPKQEESSTSSTEGRVKSEEELQLWALIDMMVQSKTMVKMYMGSLGSKGVFR